MSHTIGRINFIHYQKAQPIFDRILAINIQPASYTEKIAQVCEEVTCCVSLEVIEQPVVLDCGHAYEQSDLQRALKAKQECPYCRTPCLASAGDHTNFLLKRALGLLKPMAVGKLDEHRIGLVYEQFVRTIREMAVTYANPPEDYIDSLKRYLDSIDKKLSEDIYSLFEEEKNRAFDKIDNAWLESLQLFAKDTLDFVKIMLASPEEIKAYLEENPLLYRGMLIRLKKYYIEWTNENQIVRIKRVLAERYMDKTKTHPLWETVGQPCLTVLSVFLITVLRIILYTAGTILATPFIMLYVTKEVMDAGFDAAQDESNIFAAAGALLFHAVASILASAVAAVFAPLLSLIDAWEKGIELGHVLAGAEPLARLTREDAHLRSWTIFHKRLRRENKEFIAGEVLAFSTDLTRQGKRKQVQRDEPNEVNAIVRRLHQ